MGLKRGFSLIEISIALVIMTLVAAGMLEAFSLGFGYLKKSQEREVIYSLAQEVMEGYFDWNTLPPNGNYTNPTPYPAIINGASYDVRLNISDSPIQPAELKQIEVIVSRGTESYSLLTLKADY